MPYGQINADVIQSSVTGVSLGAGNATVFKNRIINGDMRIDQRYVGTSVTVTTDGFYTLDRWNIGETQNSKVSVQQNAGSVTPPVGFTNYLGVTSLSAYSIAAGDIFVLNQKIEGLNVADLGWGTANAKTVTLSFQVYSSLTGTFGGSVKNSAANRSYPFSYTISSANTWTQISVTIAGDTTGTWLTTNGTGISANFSVGTGSTFSGTAGAWAATNYNSATGATSVVGTNGATFYITGVQLEVGSQATSFDFRSIGQELALCQRYFEKSYLDGTAVGTFSAGDTNSVRWDPIVQGASVFVGINFNARKRTSPTMTAYDAAFNAGKASYFNGSWVNNGGTGNWNSYQSGATFPISAQTNSIAYSFAWIASAEL
jgi:hypothetical protein